MLSFCTRLSAVASAFSYRSYVNILRESHKVGNFRYFALFSAPGFKVQEISFPSCIYKYMAGHAKWQNIKHIKAEKDRQKSLLCNKYVRQVVTAVREKGPDPKTNNQLARILEEAKKNNVPSSTLESAMKTATSKKFSTGTVEMLAPGGCLVIFEYETDNLPEMRRALKYICRRHGAGIFPGTSERWRAAYDQKGIVRVTKYLNGDSLDPEKMLDAAIEAGAEDVQKIDEEGFYEFLCAPEDLNVVKKELELKFEVEEAFVGYLPMSTVSLSDDDKTLALNFINDLAELPDVARLYENLE